MAALTLNIFNAHGDRVRMANIAQTVNVLQALILTDGARMLTTPTYHVFDLYKAHQDAVLLPCQVEADPYTLNGAHIPQISAAASRNRDGRMHLTLCNVDPEHNAEIACVIHGAPVGEVMGTVLTADDMRARNTFRDPGRVTPVRFEGARPSREGLAITLPPMSVVALSATA